ncbi:MAG: glycerophosphodiester phosphodiesterase [Deltaproteobacteria bacterium]|nr:glycerophosphodiester phosphodiesterase [Deltaproteobacteria bacterium]MBW2220234.1 glycerophosphodiester phosphodiesterase [Deltaproteobacteria bacterium]
MKPASIIEKIFMLSADTMFSIIPRRVPDRESLMQCKVVAHRGDHDNNNKILENTIPAFDRVLENSIWGFEFDIRWTSDLKPVVFHDADLMRLFDSPLKIKDLTFDQIKKDFPLIPSLEEVIHKYGNKLHIFAEIKEEIYPDPALQNNMLKELFASLEPVKDYHILSLCPDMFKVINFAPEHSFIPVAETNMRDMSELALSNDFGGVCGHYLFVTDDILRKHHKKGQGAGTGYASSANCLFREMNRGVDWIFSNNAVEIQGILNQLM